MDLKDQTGQERQKIGDTCADTTSGTQDKHTRVSEVHTANLLPSG